MITGFDVDKNIKLTIDGSNVDEALTDYPILVNLTDSSGLNNFDCANLFGEFCPNIDGTFTGDDGTTPVGWVNINDDEILIDGNKAAFDFTDGGNARLTISGAVDGDFTATIYWTMTAGMDSGGGHTALEIYDTVNDHTYYIGRVYDGGGESLKARVYDPAYTNYFTATTYDEGYLRIKREGTTIYLQYRVGSSENYTTLVSRTTISTGKCNISLLVNQSVTVTGNFDNLELTCPRKKIAIEYMGYPDYNIESVDDDFTGDNDDPPRTDLWTTTSGNISFDSSITIQSNQAYIEMGGTDTGVRSTSIYTISGDFDVEIDISGTSSLASNSQLLRVEVASATDSTAYAFLGFGYVSPSKRIWDRIQAPGTACCNDSYITRTNDYGSLRLVRKGSNITTKYKDGTGAWTTLTLSEPFCDHDVNVKLDAYRSDTGYTTTGNMDNLVVHYGTIDWNGNTPVTVLKQSPSAQQCKVEIERWSHAHESAQLWVKVPEIAAGVDTTLYLYYDDTATANTTYIGVIGDGPAKDVWSNGYRAVYHLSQETAAGSDNLIDSVWAGTTLDGVPSNIYPSNITDGVVGKATDFNGTNEYFTIANHTYIQLSGDSTIEYVFNFPIDATRRNLYHKAYGAEGSATCQTNGQLYNYYGTAGIDSEPYQNSSITNAADAWHSVTHVRDFSGSLITVYKDSVIGNRAIALYDAGSTSSLDLKIGDGYTADYLGQIRSFRMSIAARSESWGKFIYYSDFDKAMTYQHESFKYSGYVTVGGQPAARTVHLYLRSNGELIDTTISSEIDGYFEVSASIDDYHFVNILPDIEDDYNLISYDKIHPSI